MKLHKLRNATIILEYAGKKFLINPAFASKEENHSGFLNNLPLHNLPLHNLPLPPKDIVKNIDAVIITSFNTYHFDKKAENIIPKTTKIFVNDKNDKDFLLKAYFKNIERMSSDGIDCDGVNLYKTKAGGTVLCSDVEPTLYFLGDTVLHECVKDSINLYKPDYIIINSAFVEADNKELKTVKIEDINNLHNYYPEGKLIVNQIDIAELLQLKNSAIREQVYIPANGEIMFYNKT